MISKRSMSSAEVTRSPSPASPRLVASQPSTWTGLWPRSASCSNVTAPWRFASRVPSGPIDQWHVGVARRGQTEQPAKVDLARRRGQQVVAPHDLGDALRGIVDHDGEVVRGHAIVAAQHYVVDCGGAPTDHRILEGNLVAIGKEAQRRSAPVGSLRRPCRGRKPAACSRITTVGVGRVVGCACCLTDLAARAEALVRPTRGHEHRDRSFIAFEALRLPYHVAIPVKPDRGQLVELHDLELAARRDAVEILHPHDEPSRRRPGRQPRHERGAEVAEVQLTGRARREPPDDRGRLHRLGGDGAFGSFTSFEPGHSTIVARHRRAT